MALLGSRLDGRRMMVKVGGEGLNVWVGLLVYRSMGRVRGGLGEGCSAWIGLALLVLCPLRVDRLWSLLDDEDKGIEMACMLLNDT